MNKFIKLHSIAKGKSIYIAQKHIVRFGESTTIKGGNAYVVIIGDDEAIFVNETVDDIKELLEIHETETDKKEKKREYFHQLFSVEIASLNLKTMTINALHNAGITKIGDIRIKGFLFLYGIQNLGKIGVDELKNEITKIAYQMNLDHNELFL